ncbi:aryl-sulfate sulfotransferase [Eudoraea sp.]|uniref:aryl-sulfate sulfotransferase n=1 Tax=Eudoraea sp. TaxID=1979955 RepID=UPI003C709FAA
MTIPTKNYKTVISLTIFFLVCLLTSCNKAAEVVSSSLELNQNAKAPLAGIYNIVADKPVKVRLSINNGNQPIIVPGLDVYAEEHESLVLGLGPNKTHEVIAVLIDEQGNETILPPKQITTPALPDDFPKLNLTMEASEKLEPGITMFTVFKWLDKFEDDPDWGYAIAVDDKGQVIWYLKTDYFIDEVRRLQNGNLFFGGSVDGRVYEIDMLGNVINEWHSAGAVVGEVAEASIPVDTDVFHHEVRELDSGNFLSLGLEVISLEDFPAAYPPSKKRAAADVASDVIIEFDKKGNTIHKWSVSDILDIKRLGAGSLTRGFYEDVYKDKYDSVPFDITHSNALYYSEAEGAAYVSSNYQCVIYKVDMETGKLKWIIGDPTGWEKPWSEKLLKPEGEFIYPYHQHGLEVTPQGTLLLFDNGGSRHLPPNKPMPAEERFSRAVEYKVNEAAGTVEELWSYGPQYERFVSPFISDADYLPETGHILITDGGRIKGEDGEPLATFGGRNWARIFEVTKEDKSRKLWEITIEDPEVGLSVYRAERFKSLYPHLDIR